MDTLALFIISLFLLALLIFHSFLFHGRYLSLSFFIFILFWSLTKEFLPNQAPYGFVNKQAPFLINKFMVITGWIITFYLGWSISELILKRIKRHEGKIFVILLLSCLVIASISYFMETTGPRVGWWKWNIKTPNPFNIRFLVGSAIPVLEAWVYFGLHFLLSYFLIFCSVYKNRIWRFAFILLPFTAIQTVSLVRPTIELRFILLFLFALIVFRFSKFEYPGIKFKFINSGNYPFLEYIPVWVFALIMSSVIFSDVFIAKKPYFLISTLPAAVLLFFTIRNIPQVIIFVLTLCLDVWFKEKSIPALIPAVFIAILQLGKLYGAFNRRKNRPGRLFLF